MKPKLSVVILNMEQHNRKIKLKNKSLDEKIYLAQKENIINMFKIMLDNMNIHNITLEVYIVNCEKYLSNDNIVGDAAFSYKKGKYIVLLSPKIIEEYHNKYNLDLELCIIHELVHLRDFYMLHEYKKIDLNPYNNRLNTEENNIFKLGYTFWTEFNAYKECFKLEKDFDYNTTYQMMKKYIDIKEKDKYIKILFKKEDKSVFEEADEYKKLVDSFIYLFSKYLAGLIFGKGRYYRYSDKTQNSKEYKKIERLGRGLSIRIVKMFHNRYGKYYYKRIYNIGLFILKNIYKDFGLCFTKIRNKTRLIKWLD